MLIDNLKHKYNVASLRALAVKMDFSANILLNWSSGRSSPNLEQLDQIAYHLGVDVFEILIEDNVFSEDTTPWRPGIENVFRKNIGRLKFEHGITEKYFIKDISTDIPINYKPFLRYINGENTKINLKTIDKMSQIFDVPPYELLERK